MSIQPEKAIERSVDSIARIYAVVIALAISMSFQTLFKDDNGVIRFELNSILSATPALVAFMFTLVPFWHGMNRHLDRCYLEKSEVVAQGALLIDFSVFFLESGILFATALTLRLGLIPYYCLAFLLALDMIWSLVSHYIHFPKRKSHAMKWSKINIVFIFVGLLVIAFPFDMKTIVLTALAVLRSIVDYWLCWDFYFPTEEHANTDAPPIDSTTPA